MALKRQKKGSLRKKLKTLISDVDVPTEIPKYDAAALHSYKQKENPDLPIERRGMLALLRGKLDIDSIRVSSFQTNLSTTVTAPMVRRKVGWRRIFPRARKSSPGMGAESRLSPNERKTNMSTNSQIGQILNQQQKSEEGPESWQCFAILTLLMKSKVCMGSTFRNTPVFQNRNLVLLFVSSVETLEVFTIAIVSGEKYNPKYQQ